MSPREVEKRAKKLAKKSDNEIKASMAKEYLNLEDRLAIWIAVDLIHAAEKRELAAKLNPNGGKVERGKYDVHSPAKPGTLATDHALRQDPWKSADARIIERAGLDAARNWTEEEVDRHLQEQHPEMSAEHRIAVKTALKSMGCMSNKTMAEDSKRAQRRFMENQGDVSAKRTAVIDKISGRIER